MADLVNKPSLFFLGEEESQDKPPIDYTDLYMNQENQTLLVILTCLLTKIPFEVFEKTYFLKSYEPNRYLSVALFDRRGDSRIREVICDDLVPCLPFHTPLGIQTKKPNQVWHWLIEKAVSKKLGSYENLWKASVEEIFPLFTGSEVKPIDFGVWEILFFHWMNESNDLRLH